MERKGFDLTLICGSRAQTIHTGYIIALRLVFYSIATAAQWAVSHGIMIDQLAKVRSSDRLVKQAELHPFPHVAVLEYSTRRLEMGLTVNVPARLKSGGFRGNQGDNRSVIHVGGSVGGPSLQR